MPDGSAPFAQWARQFQHWVRSRLLIQGDDYDLRASPKGTIMDVRTGGGASTPVAVAAFSYVTSFKNYVIGARLPGGALTQIAKPPKHRNSILTETIDGNVWTITYPQNPGGATATVTLQYISRTKSNVQSNINQCQRITPQWEANDLFFAIQCTVTEVLSEAGDTITPVGTSIGWLDMNVDGRLWCDTPDGLA